MGAFTQAFNNRLISDVTLVGMLGTYEGNPSVFTKIPIPTDFRVGANGPYIITTGQAFDVGGDEDNKNATGREIARDIRCYDDVRKSAVGIEAIAERVRLLFHRHQLAVSGFTVSIAEVTGPIEADEDDVLGRVMTVRLVMSAT